MSHRAVAASVREHREKHPELYCTKCLWRVVTNAQPTPCPRHPVAPAPTSAPATVEPSRGQSCNECTRLVGMRVEVRTSSQRLVVCATCAVTIAATDATARIVAHTPPMASLFVCSDGWYSPRAIDAKTHQDDLNAEATRFADRVRAVIERNAERQRATAERTTGEARASILSRMSARQRATLARRGISA